MILPTTYLAALLLTFVTMVCWGSWANTTKMAGKWRFELFYFDYSFGLLLAATVLLENDTDIQAHEWTYVGCQCAVGSGDKNEVLAA